MSPSHCHIGFCGFCGFCAATVLNLKWKWKHQFNTFVLQWKVFFDIVQYSAIQFMALRLIRQIVQFSKSTSLSKRQSLVQCFMLRLSYLSLHAVSSKHIFLLIKRPFCNIWIAMLLKMYFGITSFRSYEYINIKTQQEHTATLQLHARSPYYMAHHLKDETSEFTIQKGHSWNIWNLVHWQHHVTNYGFLLHTTFEYVHCWKL